MIQYLKWRIKLYRISLKKPIWIEEECPEKEERDREILKIDRCKTSGFIAIHDLEHLAKTPQFKNFTTHENNDINTRRWIFAVRRGVLHMSKDGGHRRQANRDPNPLFPLNAVKHESLFRNKPVSAAGEIEIINGIITDINNDSGTYRIPIYDMSFKKSILEVVEKLKIGMTDEVKRILK